MSDSKNISSDDILELDDDLLDGIGDDLSQLDDGTDQLDLDSDGDIGVDAGGVVKAKASGGRLWLVLMLLFFVLALISALLIGPSVDVQNQRADAAVEAVSQVSLASITAGQAMTPAGRFEPVERSIADAEQAINNLSGSQGFNRKIANALFGNQAKDQQVQELWTAYKASSEQFLANRETVQQAKDRVRNVAEVLSKTVGDSVVFVEAVAREGRNKNTGNSKDKYLFLTSEAANLNGILSRLGSSVNDYFGANTNLSQMADAQSGLIIRLQETLNRIVSNSAEVVGTAAEPLRAQYSELETRLAEIGDGASSVTESRSALRQMRERGVRLAEGIQNAANQSPLLSILNRLSTLLPLFFAGLAAFSLWRYAKSQVTDSAQSDAGLEETLADQQEAILKLLDEMSALADGDLTVEAEVTDQITGAIADSVNFAVIEMRELVSQINRASIEVANESELAVSNAQAVSQSNMSQADEISKAATMMQRVSEDMREMSQQASSSADMATESLQAAETGAQAVRDTIDGMENMREQIQDTSKRIKRLGESSQRIGDIVALIDDIAEQTNILSLNAAIQASMAGEAGRGFAVVSDEVQSLAERSTEATKKIGELVNTIQNDTNDAVLSMEKATEQVVSGTRVADSAGKALAEIENASKGLSELVQTISKGSNEYAETVSRVSEQVVDVSDSSTDTSRKAQDSANSIAKLLELAKDLETSVSRFKLPAS